MRILVGIEHPKRVHVWKNPIKKLIERGHEVKIAARDKDITLKLLNLLGFNYEIYGKNYIRLFGKAYGLIESNLKLLKIARDFDPDLFVGKGSAYMGQVSRMLSKPYICFSDTEHAKLANLLTYPFADVICTPSCFKKRINPSKHITYNGYEELAYLHPKYFKPDPSVLNDLGLSKNDKFIIMRLISWGAAHDIRSRGFSKDFLEKAIKSLEKYGHVFITSERKLNKNLEKYKIPIAPEKLHSALYYASLYFGEGGTTATESALLGTPSVHVEGILTRSGELKDVIQAQNIGVRDELVNKYRLSYTFADQYLALNKALEILDDNNAKRKQKEKLKKVLEEKIDVTAFMTDFIERYPESFYDYMSKREIEKEFKENSKI
ncbi:MAG: DUF354 domain-containing protein [Canidatus Methanoxibalbensis ujae]|nr:DUF354 domain-containing protein [Candidatus Methanoxibalbensis ujae]